MSADDDARLAQKLAARKEGKVTVETYPANKHVAAQAAAVDEATVRYNAKLLARTKAEADAKAAAAATEASEAKAEPVTEAKVEAAPVHSEARGQGRQR